MKYSLYQCFCMEQNAGQSGKWTNGEYSQPKWDGWLRKLGGINKRQQKKKRRYQDRAKPERNIGAGNRKTQITVVWAC